MWQNRISTINCILMAMKNRSDSLWIISNQPVRCSCAAVLRYFPSHGRQRERERKRSMTTSHVLKCLNLAAYCYHRINHSNTKAIVERVLLRCAIYAQLLVFLAVWLLLPSNCISNPVSFHFIHGKSMAICPFFALCISSLPFMVLAWFSRKKPAVASILNSIGYELRQNRTIDNSLKWI